MTKDNDIFEAIGEVYAYAQSENWTRAEFVKFLRDSQKDNIGFKIGPAEIDVTATEGEHIISIDKVTG